MTLRMRTVGLVLLVVLSVCECVRFGPICRGNPTNRRRTSDSWGAGYFGARRGSRVHQGLDIVCADDSEVIAPFDVTLMGRLTVYKDPTGEKAPINMGINLRGEGLSFKFFYVRPDRVSGTVRKGQRIGTMLPMQSVYPGITSHVHVQMTDKSDPTPYF
ncbi:leukocyte cell-derived chemotaxin-2-like [Neosynchiropus ocellatus]